MKQKLSRLFAAALGALVFSLAAGEALADIYEWNNPNTGNWEETTNWTNTSNTYAVHYYIDNGGTAVMSTAVGHWGSFFVGDQNQGTLILNDGAAVGTLPDADDNYLDYNLFIGRQEGSSGKVTMWGNSTWCSYGSESDVGTQGVGVLELHDNAFFYGCDFFIGFDDTGVGRVTLNDSAWLRTSAYIHNGEVGTGTLTILDNARVSVDFDDRGFFSQNEFSTLEIGLSALRGGGESGGGGTDDVAFVAALDITLAGTLNLLALEGGTAGDTLLFVLLDSQNEITGAFDTLLFEGTALNTAALYDDSDAGNGIYRWDDAAGNHYTLDTAANANTQYTLQVQVVPEPATWAMLAGGVGVLALLRRRRG